jgi:hypothetical protein
MSRTAVSRCCRSTAGHRTRALLSRLSVPSRTRQACTEHAAAAQALGDANPNLPNVPCNGRLSLHALRTSPATEAA